MIEDYPRLQQRIGYQFKDGQLLTTALSHRSSGACNNERLEFLGDSILGFVVAEHLYEGFRQASEGELSRARARIVKGESLADIARTLDLGRFLKLGEGELKSGGSDRGSILADGLEALIGAIYLDGGFEPATRFIHQHFAALIASADPHRTVKDPKTRLQELLQKRQFDVPVYRVVDISGASHAQEFNVECELTHSGQVFSGTGSSKRRAEQDAAGHALNALEVKSIEVAR